MSKLSVKVFLFFVLISATSVSCNKAFYFDGGKAKQVMITDMGEMYSTYNMSSVEKEELSRQLKNKALTDEIVRFSKENMWPDAVNTLDERINNRDMMMKYKFYKVGVIGDKTIVTIPASKNAHMPAAFIPTGPMYMIFANSVVVTK
ncbi:MAG: hypothetical protein K2Q24_08055 [Chitinophagaceae bacterium]|jgi:hypothetical protein|nr:hypothetical protein [Chitinophagaceae bacterium]